MKGPFLEFECQGRRTIRAKTVSWLVKSKVDGQGLGVIYWYSAWRRYVFSPGYAVFDAACLKEITDFLTTATKEQKEKK